MSLTNKSLSAVFWSGADMFLRQGLQFFVSILLARLLSPEDFGLLAMLYLFTGIAGLFIDSGFTPVIIQRQNITFTDESTVFFFNLGAGFVVALGLCWSAPWTAAFFDQPILRNLTYVMALNLFIGAFGSMHFTLLDKNLDFKTPTKIRAIASLVSGVTGVVLAWQGFGVWSLALQSLASTIVLVALAWLLSPWRPSFIFSFASLRSLFRTGSFLLLTQLLEILYNRLFSALIGKLFSVRDLGFYTRASSTYLLPTGTIAGMVNRVAYPVFSAAATDKAMLARGVRKSLLSIMVINIPMMLGLAVVAEPLVVTLFGLKWLPSVPLLRVLCLSGLLAPHLLINLSVLVAQGHSNLYFRIEVIKKIIGIGAIIIASFYGLMAIVWSQVAVSVISFVINAHYTGVFLKYSVWRQTVDMLPYLILSVIMSLAIWPIDLYTTFSSAIKLALMTISGFVLYVTVCWMLRLEAFEMLLELGTRHLGSRFQRILPYSKLLLWTGLPVLLGTVVWRLYTLGLLEVMRPFLLKCIDFIMELLNGADEALSVLRSTS